MRGLEELEAAPLLERYLPVGQLDLEVGRHVTCAKENRDVLQAYPFFVQLEDPVHYEPGLLLLVLCGHEPWSFAGVPLGPEILRETLGRARDHRIRHGENLRR